MASNSSKITFRPASAIDGVAEVYLFEPGGDDQAHFHALADQLEGSGEPNLVLRRIFDVVRSRGCRAVVVEQRYSDPDYRSEFWSFWSRRFETTSPAARRLHFFAEAIDAADLHQELPKELRQERYLGFSVLRPNGLGRVGRTVVVPPLELKDAILCQVLERPSLFGNELRVRGVPFAQQDGEMLRCAHIAAWLCQYVAWQRRIIGRHLTSEIAALPSAAGSKRRPLPSAGLTGEQLQGIFSEISLPAFFYDMKDLPELPGPLARLEPPKLRSRVAHPKTTFNKDELKAEELREKVWRVACKYLNSRFPIVVFTRGVTEPHAFCLVGWRQLADGRVRLIACDDDIGPYEEIADPLTDTRRGEWASLMVPLPEKVLLTGEAAETRARDLVTSAGQLSAADGDRQYRDLAELEPKLRVLDGEISVRSRLLHGRDLKGELKKRSPAVLRVYRRSHLSRWVWLVEFQDRARRRDGKPPVVAEFVFDSTSPDERPVTRLATTLGAVQDSDVLRRQAEAADEAGAGQLGDAGDGAGGAEPVEEAATTTPAPASEEPALAAPATIVPEGLAESDGEHWESLVTRRPHTAVEIQDDDADAAGAQAG